MQIYEHIRISQSTPPSSLLTLYTSYLWLSPSLVWSMSTLPSAPSLVAMQYTTLLTLMCSKAMLHM